MTTGGLGIAYNSAQSDGRRAHACHCIGCCRICGQCRTAPWHARTCERIAALNKQREAVIATTRAEAS